MNQTSGTEESLKSSVPASGNVAHKGASANEKKQTLFADDANDLGICSGFHRACLLFDLYEPTKGEHI